MLELPANLCTGQWEHRKNCFRLWGPDLKREDEGPSSDLRIWNSGWRPSVPSEQDDRSRSFPGSRLRRSLIHCASQSPESPLPSNSATTKFSQRTPAASAASLRPHSVSTTQQSAANERDIRHE